MKSHWTTELFIFLSLLLKPTSLHNGMTVDHWVVWNVGQGQWVTQVQNDICRHFDMGGEIFHLKDIRLAVQNLCLTRQNQIFISHWDYDHYSFVQPITKSLLNLCWANKPPWAEQKKTVIALKNISLPPCTEMSPEVWRPPHFRTSNDSSAVILQNTFLLPGDSPQQQERLWVSFFLRRLHSVNILVLGHHGSATSTSGFLLKRLFQLKMAIASARFAKYHHPHFLTLNRLQKFRVPVLKTEDWGNIHFSY